MIFRAEYFQSASGAAELVVEPAPQDVGLVVLSMPDFAFGSISLDRRAVESLVEVLQEALA